jgi:activator of HSP90 ATPase
MEHGFVQGMQRIAWVKRPHMLSLRPKQGEIMLENNIIKGSVIPAYICKTCKKIVMDYSEKDYVPG